MAQQPTANEPQVTASSAPTMLRRDATPTLFADGLLGGSIEAGVVRLELLARQLDPEIKSLSPAVVGRLMMPTEHFRTFVAALVDLSNKITVAKPQS